MDEWRAVGAGLASAVEYRARRLQLPEHTIPGTPVHHPSGSCLGKPRQGPAGGLRDANREGWLVNRPAGGWSGVPGGGTERRNRGGMKMVIQWGQPQRKPLLGMILQRARRRRGAPPGGGGGRKSAEFLRIGREKPEADLLEERVQQAPRERDAW
jgi:hypothetical protein